MRPKDLMREVERRVAAVRAERTQADGTVPLPAARWCEVLAWTYPVLWPEPPALPPGWCDLAVALSDHVSVIDPAARVTIAIEHPDRGRLQLQFETEVGEAWSVMLGYSWLSRLACRECGASGIRRQLPDRALVLCDLHNGGDDDL